MEEKCKETRALQKRFMNLMGNLHSEFSCVLNGMLTHHNITPQQHNVLRILRGAGEPLTLGTIKERLFDKNSDAPRLIKRMEDKGLIKKEAGVQDKRQSLISLDDGGWTMLNTLEKEHPDFPYDLLNGIQNEVLEQTAAGLEEIAKHIKRGDSL